MVVPPTVAMVLSSAIVLGTGTGEDSVDWQPDVMNNVAKRASSTSGLHRIVSLIETIPSLMPIRKKIQRFQLFRFEHVFLIAEVTMQLSPAVFVD